MTFTKQKSRTHNFGAHTPWLVDDAILWATKIVEESQPSKKSFLGSFHQNSPHRWGLVGQRSHQWLPRNMYLNLLSKYQVFFGKTLSSDKSLGLKKYTHLHIWFVVEPLNARLIARCKEITEVRQPGNGKQGIFRLSHVRLPQRSYEWLYIPFLHIHYISMNDIP